MDGIILRSVALQLIEIGEAVFVGRWLVRCWPWRAHWERYRSHIGRTTD